MAILMDELTKSEMWAIYMMASGEEMTDQVSKTDLVRIICVLCKKLDWVENHNSFNYLPQEAKSTMEMKLNFRGMAILMDALSKSEMWAIYLMASGQEMTDKVSKADLVRIICVLCKNLDWVEQGDKQIELITTRSPEKDSKNRPQDNKKYNSSNFDAEISTTKSHMS